MPQQLSGAVYRRRAIACFCVLALLPLLAMVTASGFTGQPRSQSARIDDAQSAHHDPDSSCAPCHQAIVDRYRRTPMAQASGSAIDHLIPGEFTHTPSGVHYRIFPRDGTAWMSFSRDAGHGRGALSGEEQLLYYIGSSHRGRTYLYERDGLWFELPVNFYTRSGWDMTPNHLHDTNMPNDLPIDAGCLHCHATSADSARPNARNSFLQPPFAQGGIGCRACHGDPSAHLAAQGHGPILNPAKLGAAKRDSICTQCHLEGNVIVDRPSRSIASFAPGDNLNDDATYFVLAAEATGGARATSQWEALAASACKRSVGDRMTCTTCHDPHGDPQSPEERVEYFRARCLNCHTNPKLATQHHPEQRSCAACHMPRSATSDIAHEQVTDHDIELRPHHQATGREAAPVELVPVSGFTASTRDLGLAFAQWAEVHNDAAAGERALNLLHRAENNREADEQVHENLGFLEQRAGDDTAAEREYQQALAANPYSPVASTDLAVLDLRGGHTAEAARLLEHLVAADPSQTRAGLTLALVECLAGHADEARTLTLKLQLFAHDSPEVREFLQHGTYSGLTCSAMQSHS